MIQIFRDYILAIFQLNQPRLWKPVIWATLLSLASIFLVMVIGGAFLFQLVNVFSSSLTGWMSWADGWLGGMVAILGTFFIAVVGYFFLLNIYAAFLGLFLDDALDAVRETHYPHTEWIKPPGIIESSITSLRFILWSLLVYFLASPILLVGYFLPPIGLVLQFLLGGYLLGREYGQLVELRLPREERIKKTGSLLHGTLATLLWAFPVVNLLAPLLLAVSLVHYRIGQKEKSSGFSTLKQN